MAGGCGDGDGECRKCRCSCTTDARTPTPTDGHHRGLSRLHLGSAAAVMHHHALDNIACSRCRRRQEAAGRTQSRPQPNWSACQATRAHKGMGKPAGLPSRGIFLQAQAHQSQWHACNHWRAGAPLFTKNVPASSAVASGSGSPASTVRVGCSAATVPWHTREPSPTV